MRPFLALLLCVGLATGCGGGRQWTVARFTNIGGTAKVYGPVPTYQHYDGFNPLRGDVYIALMKDGRLEDSRQLASSSYPPGYLTDSGFWFEESEFYIDEGVHGLVFITGHGTEQGGELFDTPGVPNYDILAQGPQVDIHYGQDVTGLTAEHFTTGSGPYATLHGEFLVNGNLLHSEAFQVVLKPQDPPPGISSDTGFVWNAEFSEADAALGKVRFDIPYVTYGSYTLSYAGSGIRSGDDPLQVEERALVVDSASEDVGALRVTATWQERPFELGEIRGTLTGELADGMVLRAIRTDIPADSENDADFFQRAFWHYDAPKDNRDYTLGWLMPGEYDVELLAADGAAISATHVTLTESDLVINGLAVTTP
jgi:hypothetical protein